jgi:hypothetical protein
MAHMGDGFTKPQSEQEHQDAVDNSEQRTDAVDTAVEKLVAYIEDHPENPSFGKQPDSEFQTTLPMSDKAPDQTP